MNKITIATLATLGYLGIATAVYLGRDLIWRARIEALIRRSYSELDNAADLIEPGDS